MTAKQRDIVEYLSRFKAGDALPSIPAIADATGYERKTVREVYQRLDAVGVITVRHGKPTILNKDPLNSEEHF